MPPDGQAAAALAGKVALVTGGVGFIGGALSAALARSGLEVHTVSRRAAKPPGARHWQADLTDAGAVADLVKATKPDYVFHLASHVMGAPDLEHVLPAFHSNLQTTVNLLTVLAEVGCARVITTGSLVEPDPADRAAVPNSPYAAAKWASSDYARMFHALYGLPVSIARVFMVYGPGQQDLTKLVPYVIGCGLRGEPPMITSGRHRIDWIYVDDVVQGFLELAVAPGVEGASVDLGSGSPVTIRELVDELCEVMGDVVSPLYGALPDRPLEPIRVADVAATVRAIGWSPSMTLREGLLRTVEWYTANRAALESGAELAASGGRR